MAILHQPTQTKENLKRVSRLVVLPDYQGLGIGRKFLDFMAEKYVNDNIRFSIVTSTPALLFSLKSNKNWICKHIGRKSKGSTTGACHKKKLANSSWKRKTTSWEYKT